MVVRVKVRVRYGGKCFETVVLVNAGAETDVPVIALPLEHVERLGLGSVIEEPIVVREFSVESIGYLLPRKVVVELLDESGRVLSSVESYVLVKPGLDEPTISDALIEELGIIILKAKKGLWRHVSDPEGVVRESARA